MNPIDLAVYEMIYSFFKSLFGLLVVIVLLNYTIIKIYFINPEILPPILRREVKKWIDKTNSPSP